MKILHLEASSGWGGQEIRILRESEGMRARGHEVILGVMKGGGLISQARNAGFTVFALNFNRYAWIGTLVRLLWIIWRYRINLVNTHSSLDGWIGGIAARIARCPIIRTRHLSTPIKPGWNSRILYGRLADFVVTTCASIIPMICRQSGKPMELCRSIATGVDPEQIVVKKEEKEKFRKQFGSDDFVVGTACFMRSWKGIEDFLKAAVRLRHVHNLKWVIIGGGQREKYERMARGMGLEGIVQFTGHLPNPFPAIAALDVFALLSTANEGISQALLQAAFLKKPLVATPTGGLAEVCLDRETGILVPPGSPERVADAVSELMEKGALQTEFGKKARALVEERFTIRHTLEQMEEVYRQILL